MDTQETECQFICSLQFLCLKNIRTFLMSCNMVFAMKKSDLFEAFDLFDVRDFGKVKPTSIILLFCHNTMKQCCISTSGVKVKFPTLSFPL